MAFNFCFTATYPDNSEDKMRVCAQSYKRLNKIVEGSFAEVIKHRREQNNQRPQSKWPFQEE